METVNSQISASHQSVTDTKNPMGSYRNGPSRRRRRPRKSPADRRLDLSQRNASLKPRKLQSDLYTDVPAENPSASEFFIDGLYPNDDVIYPPPPNFSHCQISAQELPADTVSPRARDVNHNRSSSIREGQILCPPQEDNKPENHKRTPHVLPDESEHKIHSTRPSLEPNIRDRQAAKGISYNNEQVLRPLFQRSILPISPPMSRDASSSTTHNRAEQNMDEVEVSRAETVSKVSETRAQVAEPVSDMYGGHIMVGIERELNQEQDLSLPISQRSKSPLVRPLSRFIPKRRPPTHNARSNKSSGGAPISRAFEPIGGPWIDQDYQIFLDFEMWP